MRSIIYAAIAATAGIAVLAWIFLGSEQGAPPAELAGATGTLTAEQTFHDFGSISMRNGKVRHSFVLRNDSGAPALIEKLYTSCMCTSVSLEDGGKRFGPFGMSGHEAITAVNRVVAPGRSVSVEAEFDPNAHGPAGTGRNDRVVSVLMGGRRVLELGFTAYVTP